MAGLHLRTDPVRRGLRTPPRGGPRWPAGDRGRLIPSPPWRRARRRALSYGLLRRPGGCQDGRTWLARREAPRPTAREAGIHRLGPALSTHGKGALTGPPGVRRLRHEGDRRGRRRAVHRRQEEGYG